MPAENTIVKLPFLPNIEDLKLYHQYLHQNGPGEWFWLMNGSRNQSNDKDLDKNMNSNFFDWTVTFYAFDFNSYACSPDEVNGGYSVVP